MGWRTGEDDKEDTTGKRQMTRYAINGRFLTRQVTGVDRYAREIVRELDGMVSPGEAVVVVPRGVELVKPLDLASIHYVRYGGRSGHWWEQVEFSAYCRKNGFLGVSLCNTAPMRNPGVVCIHDMAVRANEGNYSKKFIAWYRILFSAIIKRAKAIITVSEFSKREIEKYYPTARGKITVIPNAWQHMQRVDADGSALARYDLKPDGYWFAMSSLAPNKNLRWLMETALLNPGETVAIAGGMNAKVFGEHGIPEAGNVRYLGYVTDGEAKALMAKCRGFLFPTFYEGFGIPPMEAMASGASCVVVSDTEVMHEVYGDAVVYIDPHVPLEDLNGLPQPLIPSDTCLNGYSWHNSAKRLLQLIRSIGEDVN